MLGRRGTPGRRQRWPEHPGPVLPDRQAV